MLEKLLEYTSLFDESLKRVKVVRKGKPVWKVKTNRPGYKVQYIDGKPKEVKMAAQELRKRKISAKKAARKAKAKKNIASKKRAISNKKRTW